MTKIDYAMKKAIKDGAFPGAVLLFSEKNEIKFHSSYGKSNIFTGELVTKETIFDLASFTKPLATTLAMMILAQDEIIDPEEKISTVLPQFKNTDKESILVRHLLTHTSGYDAHRPYFEQLRNIEFFQRKAFLKKLLIQEKLINPIGKMTVYSDLGFMVLHWIIEEVTGTSLDIFVHEKIFEPLGLSNLFFPASNFLEKNLKIQYAATEKCPWRNKVLMGEVHDDNTYVIGGVCGQAGLFGDAQSVYFLLKILMEVYCGFIKKHKIFNEKVLRYFLSKQKNTHRTLGFDTPTRPGSSSGKYFSENTVGHLGFTGTSFWMDLERQIIVILLTNRVHPRRDNIKIRKFRPYIHDLIMAGLLKNKY